MIQWLQNYYLVYKLYKVFKKPLIVLINEYNTSMHAAIEHNYGLLVGSYLSLLQICSYLIILMLFQANSSFGGVLSSLLKVCQHCSTANPEVTIELLINRF